MPDDEVETQRGLTEAMLAIQRKTHADTGYAHRAVHAKAHGYLKARFEVLPDLPTCLAQGLFERPATYDTICVSARHQVMCSPTMFRPRAV